MMSQRLSAETWRNIFRNTSEVGDEVTVMWLDSTNGSDEWVLTNADDANPELFEDGFSTEQEAQERLDFVERRYYEEVETE